MILRLVIKSLWIIQVSLKIGENPANFRINTFNVRTVIMRYKTLFKDNQLDYSIVVDKEKKEYLMVINPGSFFSLRRAYRLTPREIQKFIREDSRLLELAKALIADSSQTEYAERLIAMVEDWGMPTCYTGARFLALIVAISVMTTIDIFSDSR